MWKSKFYGAFVLNRRVVLHAIDTTPARWRGDACSSPLDRARTAASSPRNDLVKNCRVRPTHWLISTQVVARVRVGAGVEEPRVVAEARDGLVQELSTECKEAVLRDLMVPEKLEENLEKMDTDKSGAVWKSTSASGAPDNSSLSHFSAMARPSWLGRAVRNEHHHAIEQASRRWRGGRRDYSARTRRKV